MKQEEKIKKCDGRFRKPFYDMGDQIFALVDINTDDETLKSILKEILIAREKLRKHLNCNYLWD